MNTRIKYLRKDVLKMTQDDFSSRIGLSRNFIAQIETGAKTPSDRTVNDICREFNVNEEWIRTGKGEMFIDISREKEIARFTKDLMLGEPDSFKNRLISALAKLSVEEWEVLEKIARTMAEENAKKE